MAVFKDRLDIRKDIEEVHAETYYDASVDHAELSARFACIAQRYGVTVKEVERYYELFTLVDGPASRVVIFYNEPAFLRGDPECFGFRTETRMLPLRSVFVGAALENGMGFVEPPYIGDATQKADFEASLREALDAVGLIDHEWAEGPYNAGSPTLVPEL